jgi:plastocyanin
VLTRRALIQAGGLVLAGLAAPRRGPAGAAVEIAMQADPTGADVWFEPAGILVAPGQTVRWVMRSPGNPHTTTAYHPRNARHALRIPEGAAPWDSGFLLEPGQWFEVTLAVEGVYDYFCLPHEHAGMVGRIVVGRPGGPGALPFDHFAGRPEAADWLPVPPAARRAFPDVAAIVRDRVVRRLR